MINIKNKSSCCGCSACASVCPKSCITMQADGEGFLYPKVDQALCVNCGLCEKVCPVLHPPAAYEKSTAYAAKHQSREVRLNSSSGGVFSALAAAILETKGVVFGAGFDKDWNVCHQSAETLEDLDKLRRSKYVQSDIGKTFQQAKQFLDKGRQVLFTGTPCQIVGLKNYLGKDYENLLTVDIICHAVPSPAVWKQFLTENFKRTYIQDINFRDKFFSWYNSHLGFTTNKGHRIHGDKKPWTELVFFSPLFARLTPFVHYNIFLKAFLKELINRPSCHSCHFKNGKHWSDFTLGDLWGKWPSHIESKQDKKWGISVLIVSSDKGSFFLQKINSIHYVPISMEKVTSFNSPLLFSTKPHPKRAEFFARYQKEPLNKLIPALLSEKTLPIQILQHIYRRLFCVLHRS